MSANSIEEEYPLSETRKRTSSDSIDTLPKCSRFQKPCTALNNSQKNNDEAKSDQINCISEVVSCSQQNVEAVKESLENREGHFCSYAAVPLVDMEESKFEELWHMNQHAWVKEITVAIENSNYSLYNITRNARAKQFQEIIQSDIGTHWLFEACKGDSFDILEDLLKARDESNVCQGQNVHKESNSSLSEIDNLSPLVNCQSLKMFELLLNHGFDVNCLGFSKVFESYITPLQFAILSKSQEMFEMLISHGAKVDNDLINFVLTTGKGKQMYKLIIENIEDSIDPNRIISRQNYVDNKMSDSDIYHNEEKSLFSLAVEKGKINFVSELIKRGADVNKVYLNGTPLMVAAKSEKTDNKIISLLIENGALRTINTINRKGLTALMISVNSNNFPAFRTLVDAGADITIKYNGNTVLKYLLSAESFRFNAKPIFISYLLSHGGTLSSRNEMYAVHKCIALKQFDVLKSLITHGVSPTVMWKSSSVYKTKKAFLKDFKGVLSPLCMALACGQVTIAKSMLQYYYVTQTDLICLPQNKKLRDHLLSKNMMKSLEILNEMSSSPPTLMLLSFTKISEMCSYPPKRQYYASELKMPSRLKKALMFRDFDIFNDDDELVFEDYDSDDEESLGDHIVNTARSNANTRTNSSVWGNFLNELFLDAGEGDNSEVEDNEDDDFDLDNASSIGSINEDYDLDEI